MNSASLMLALGLPAAQSVARQTTNLVGSVSGAFAQLLGRSEAVAVDATASLGSAGESVSDSLQTLAGRMRRWLAENGVDQPFSIFFRVEPDGESQLAVSGDGGREVEQLLASDVSWQSEMRSLASTAQTEAMRRGFIDVPSVSLEIDDQQAKLW